VLTKTKVPEKKLKSVVILWKSRDPKRP
jgi:hypothetical protein